MTKRKTPTKLDGIVAHAQGAGPEAEVAQNMLVTRGNPVRDVTVVEDMDPTAIVQRAEQALELALAVPDIKRIRDEASTLTDYLRRRQYGEGTVNKALRLVRLAEWRIGDELIRMKDSGERPKAGKRVHGTWGGLVPHDPAVDPAGQKTMAYLGIERHQGGEWQALARNVTYERLDEELEFRAANGDPLTFAAIKKKFLPSHAKGEQVAWEQQNDDFTDAIEQAVSAGQALFESLKRGRPLASDRAGATEWRTEIDRLTTAIKQQVAFLRRMEALVAELDKGLPGVQS